MDDDNFKKNPDYTLRINGTRKLFVEVMKPSVDILKSAKAAFQTRRYGWNGGTGISILTNFKNLVIYDCRHRPEANDDYQIARFKVFNLDQYESDFEELTMLTSFLSAKSGLIDELFSLNEFQGQKFDDYFLAQIEDWREQLERSAIQKNAGLISNDLNFLIQRFLNRIIFLQICEDRTISRPDTLKSISSYSDLKKLFIESDKRFDSDFFDFIEDTLSLTIELDSEVLISIFQELYYPKSIFKFSVVDPTILSQFYEYFLGSRIQLDEYAIQSVDENRRTWNNHTKELISKTLSECLGDIGSKYLFVIMGGASGSDHFRIEFKKQPSGIFNERQCN